MTAPVILLVIILAIPWVSISAIIAWCLRGSDMFRHDKLFWISMIVAWPGWVVVFATGDAIGALRRRMAGQ